MHADNEALRARVLFIAKRYTLVPPYPASGHKPKPLHTTAATIIELIFQIVYSFAI